MKMEKVFMQLSTDLKAKLDSFRNIRFGCFRVKPRGATWIAITFMAATFFQRSRRLAWKV